MRIHSGGIALIGALGIAAWLVPSLSLAASGDPAKKSFDVFSDESDALAPEPSPGRPRALVIVVGAGDRSASLAFRLGKEASFVLAKKTNLEAADLESVLAPKAKAMRKQEIAAALKEIERGQRAFEDLDLERAGSVFEGAINALLSDLDELDPEPRKTLESAIFTYGATTLFEGQTDLAESIFVALVLLAPKYAPSLGQYPSNVVSRFEELRSTVEQRPTGGMKVHTVPDGADIFVDGSFKGASPIEIAGLADGQHVLVARRLGYKPFGTLAPVTRDRMASIDVDLERAVGVERILALSPELASDVRALLALGKEVGVQRIAALRLDAKISTTKVEGILADVETEALIGRIKELAIVPDPEIAAETIVARLLQGDALALAATPSKGGAEITYTWWFWVIVGGAIVVAAGITALAISSSEGERHPPPNGIVLGF